MSVHGRTVAAITLGVFLAAVGVLVLWPSHLDTYGLYAGIDRLLSPLVANGLPGILLHDGALEFAGNIAMFIPLGFLGTLCLPPKLWWVAALACIALSCGIEFTQLIALHGRSFSVRDIIGNSAGGLAGVIVAVTARGVATAVTRRRRRTAAG